MGVTLAGVLDLGVSTPCLPCCGHQTCYLSPHQSLPPNSSPQILLSSPTTSPLTSTTPNLKSFMASTLLSPHTSLNLNHKPKPSPAMASTLFSTPTFTGLRPLKPTDSSLSFPRRASLALSARPPVIRSSSRHGLAVKAELNPSLVIILSTGLSLFLGRFVFFNFQRENVAKQALPEQNGMTHYEAGDSRAKEYVGLLKSNDPVGFNIVDVLAWGSIGHIVAYYILATSSNGYDPKFF